MWLCGYVGMWLCGYVAMGLCGCGYVVVWVNGYVIILNFVRIPRPADAYQCPVHVAYTVATWNTKHIAPTTGCHVV